MLGRSSKNVIMGNVQLINYCKNNSIKMSKLNNCNIEKMGNTYFFVLTKGFKNPTMENDIASQPDVVLTMDATEDIFKFSNTKWTSRVI